MKNQLISRRHNDSLNDSNSNLTSNYTKERKKNFFFKKTKDRNLMKSFTLINMSEKNNSQNKFPQSEKIGSIS